MTAFPHQPEEITADWLSAVLGGSVDSFELEQIGVGVGLLGRLYRVTLRGTGVPASVVAKFPTLDEGARANVTTPLGFYSNEVSFYNEGAKLTPIGTAKVFTAQFDEPTGDFVLVLEDIADRRCEDQTVGCSVESAEIAIDALCRVHARWWNSDFAELPWIKSYVTPPYPQIIAATFAQSWPVALDIVGQHLPGDVKAFGDRFADLVPWFLERASEPPVTLCHGDFRLDNLFYATKPEHQPVTALDWQICFRGNPGYDLGYFISQSLATDTRRQIETDLIDRYARDITAAGIELDRAKLDDAYARTVAYCFIYPIAACGQIEVTAPRMVELVQGMTNRSVAAIQDCGALDLLPS
jgi:hypothetical protein